MRPGDVLAERFVIERLAGAGGMGAVWRAVDRMDGRAVALKVLHPGLDDDQERFGREARVLAELMHPAVVRYIAHGVAPSQVAWLAMEWLDGEDLAQRLDAGGMMLDDAALICRRAAEALGVAHARGILHRDVKPSNVFLVDGEPAKTKLLDFGIARRAVRSQAVTRTGGVLGTIGYMSPELAAGATDLDARSDVFALGCVLFECLTGTPAFAGNPAAVLGKLLAADVRRVREIAPGVPHALDALVARMLAKERSLRPADGAAVARALAELPDLRGTLPPPAARSPAALTGSEQRLVSAMLAEIEPRGPTSDTLTGAELESSLGPARALLQRLGGEVTAIPGGTLLMTLARRGSATDIASQTASCALRLLALYPDARIALATARAQTNRSRPSGPVVERAAALLAAPAGQGVRIDEVTAGLLDPRFEIEGDGPVRLLVRAGAEAADTRRLLGRATPCVGRDKELALLVATFEECLSEPVARSVLVTAPAGGGKSRLRRELMKRTRAAARAAVLWARGDPLSAGSALELVRQIVRQAAGTVDNQPAERQYQRIAAYAKRLFADQPGRTAAEVQRLGEFLGELAGSPPPEPGPELRAARGEPRALAEWLRRAFEATIAAECTARPVLVVLEDLHWGDQPSVSFLAAAARHAKERPLMLLALARPEVHDAFPLLSLGPELLELQLAGLTRRASEALVRAVLGDGVAPATMDRIVERADGNAFYLEELIRRVAEQGDEELPDTVLAMVEARLEALPAEARRVLRAASVFGMSFGSAGVAALVGDGADVAGWLPTLVGQELIEPSRGRPAITGHPDSTPGSRTASEDRFAFRHALIREAAYGTLTTHDRVVGHGLAAALLESRGERDPLALAEHWTRAAEPRRALPWLARAAQAALEASNLEAAYALAARGVAAGAAGEMLGHLRTIQAQVVGWEARWVEAANLAEEARGLVQLGSTEWFRAAVVTLFAAMSTNRAPIDVLSAIQALPSDPEPSGPYARALSLLATGMVLAGQKETALALLQRLVSVERADVDPAFAGWRELARATASLLILGDLGAALRRARAAIALLDDAGDAVGRALAMVALARAQLECGCFDDARHNLDEAVTIAEQLGTAYLRDWALVLLAIAHNRSGRWREGMEVAVPATHRGGTLTRFIARNAVANAWLISGDAERAEREARASLEEAGWMPLASAGARSLLARIELARGRADAALAEADEGLRIAAQSGEPLLDGSTLHLVRAEALRDNGDPRAVEVIRAARARIERVAAGIDDPDLRRVYLEELAPNARTLELAAAWCGDSSPTGRAG